MIKKKKKQAPLQKKKNKKLQYVSPILTSQIKQTTLSIKTSSLALWASPPPQSPRIPEGTVGVSRCCQWTVSDWAMMRTVRRQTSPYQGLLLIYRTIKKWFCQKKKKKCLCKNDTSVLRKHRLRHSPSCVSDEAVGVLHTQPLGASPSSSITTSKEHVTVLTSERTPSFPPLL